MKMLIIIYAAAFLSACLGVVACCLACTPWCQRLRLTVQHAWSMWRVLSLPKNRAKGSWQDIPPYTLLCLLEKEVAELKAALWQHDRVGGQRISRQVASEAADVSAFAAMIADNCRAGRRA